MAAIEVGFSKRYENIVKITKRLCETGQDVASAKTKAQTIEERFLSVAGTADEYQTLCDDYVEGPHAISTPFGFHRENGTPDEIFNHGGPTFGKYEWATFHSEGQTSTIYKAKAQERSGQDQTVALKVMSPNQMQPPHNALREVRVLQQAKGDHIIPLIEAFHQPGGKLVLVFPFLRQDLENLLRTGTLTKAQRLMVFDGLCKGLAHLHSLGIIHRDIKPSNILLKSVHGPVYLIDFGIAWAEGDAESEEANKKITDVGTACYRPPELLFGDRTYGAAVDMWAAGCVVAEMVKKGHYPLFDAGDLGSELGLIKSMFSTLGTPNEATWPSAKQYPDWGKVKFQEFPARPWKDLLPGASDHAIDFVKSTVCYEPKKRLTAVEALNHPLAQEFR